VELESPVRLLLAEHATLHATERSREPEAKAKRREERAMGKNLARAGGGVKGLE
jgi:hypothetical protein